CLTPKLYVPEPLVLPRNENTESSPVGTEPPVHVTFVTTAFSPEPLCWTVRFQPPVSGKNESIEKPCGGVSSIEVVVAPSFSVGTASVNTWPSCARATGGLTCAWAHALLQTTSA